jgi:hypothetical protein
MPRTARPKPSHEELRSWFDRQLPPDRLLTGLRSVGFSADAIADVVGAPGRETVYAWAAGRSQPTQWNAEQLDRLRVIVSWICKQEDLGPSAVWLVLNGWPGGLDPTGPNGLELLANRESGNDWQILAAALGMTLGSNSRPAADKPRKPAAADSDRRREHA